jgi:hypothetical protein
MTTNFDNAFSLENPAVELRWGLHEKPFRDHFEKSLLTQITAGHFKARCRLLGGIESDVHFHFAPRQAGRFTEVELYRQPMRQRQRGFDDWQERLTALLGVGEKMAPQLPIDTSYHWQVGRVSVMHRWYYQAGEHERILFTCENP